MPVLSGLLALVLLAACQAGAPPVALPTATAAGLALTPGPLPVDVEPGDATAPVECVFVWASPPQPEAAQHAAAALQDAGLDGIDVQANAFGENCVDPASGGVTRFLAMQTDFTLTIPVASVDDAQELGEWLERVLPILANLPTEQVPGPQMGYLTVQFAGPAAETGLRFAMADGLRLLEEGLSGSALYSALQGQ